MNGIKGENCQVKNNDNYEDKIDLSNYKWLVRRLMKVVMRDYNKEDI